MTSFVIDGLIYTVITDTNNVSAAWDTTTPLIHVLLPDRVFNTYIVTSISDYGFNYCPSLQSISINQSINSLGFNYFIILNNHFNSFMPVLPENL